MERASAGCDSAVFRIGRRRRIPSCSCVRRRTTTRLCSPGCPRANGSSRCRTDSTGRSTPPTTPARESPRSSPSVSPTGPRPGSHARANFTWEAAAPWPPGERRVLENLAAGLRRGGCQSVHLVDRIGPYKSAKLMYNAAISPLAAAAGVDNGQLLGDPLAQRLFFCIVAGELCDSASLRRAVGAHRAFSSVDREPDSQPAGPGPDARPPVSPWLGRNLLLYGPGHRHGTNGNRGVQWLSEMAGSGRRLFYK